MDIIKGGIDKLAVTAAAGAAAYIIGQAMVAASGD